MYLIMIIVFRSCLIIEMCMFSAVTCGFLTLDVEFYNELTLHKINLFAHCSALAKSNLQQTCPVNYQISIRSASFNFHKDINIARSGWGLGGGHLN